MKRLHVHVSVDDLAKSIEFYSTLFAAEPTVTKDDCQLDRIVARVDAHGSIPDIHQRPDVASLQLVAPHGFDDRFRNLLFFVRNRHHADVGRVEQSIHVLMQLENGRS